MTKESTQPLRGPLRGMRDILPHDALRMQHIMSVAQSIAASYGYHLMDTPLLERTDLFARGIGESTDVVGKEMYSFLDKNEEYIALRPEMTAGVVRAAHTHHWQQNLPVRVFYQGAMFRHERPQKGRYRQFHQIGVEALGLGSGKQAAYGDVEIISMGFHILKTLGIADKIVVEVNTLGSPSCRGRYREALLSWLVPRAQDLSLDSQKRLQSNPLRILDSKSEQDREILTKAPNLADYQNEESAQRYQTVLEGLSALGIDVVENPKLVRGLDYYGHTIFEFVQKDGGSQGTVMAGGCYDGLSGLLGGPDMSGIGWASGVERLAHMLKDQEENPPEALDDIAIIPIGDRAANWCMVQGQEWRQSGLSMVTIAQDKLKKALKIAAKQGFTYVLMVGDDEIEQNQICIRNLKTGTQEHIDKEKVLAYFHTKRGS